MKFHLNYTVPNFDFEISHKDQCFLIGSCFSENIGNLLNKTKFKTHSNPNGILFNPLSISNTIDAIISEKKIEEAFLLRRDNLFFSYLHHTSIHASSQEELIALIEKENANALHAIKNANFLFLTFGTAYLYELRETKQIVANCHKQTASTFHKRMASVSEIVKNYSEIISKLKVINPNIKLIFTVSPVKHLKDGLIENTISKSTLILAIQSIVNENSNCYYFPAFELVNDDLRDYRFYKEDLAHPNDLAIQYVWQKFSDCFFSSKTLQINQLIAKLNSAMSHKNMITSAKETMKLEDFIARQKDEIKKLDAEIEL